MTRTIRVTKRLGRRGSVYVLVLVVSLIVVIVGLGAVALARAGIRTTAAAADWSEAGNAAQAGLEYALAVMNTSSTWRADAKSGVPMSPMGVARAKVSVMIVDEIDGDLSNDPSQVVRIYAAATIAAGGAGSIGGATRCYSVQAAPASVTGLDVLRSPVHAAGNLTVTGAATTSLGPVSCAANLSNSAQLAADVETSTLSSSGFIAGAVRTGVAAKTMPGATSWATLSSLATTIPYGSLSGGTIDRAVLSPGVNTAAGSANGSGVYAITVPALSTLTIKRSRLQASLLVSLSASAKLVVQDENAWDPANAGYPSLVVQGALLSSVSLGGSTTGSALSEATTGTNYNPAGAPFGGLTDLDTADTFPCELHGVFHVISSIPLTLTSNIKVVGCVIAAGTCTIDTPANLTANPALLTTPPVGYSDTAATKMSPVAGTYRWEVADVNASVTP